MSHIVAQDSSKFLLPLIQQAVNVSCNKNVYCFIGSDDTKCQRLWYDINIGSKLLGLGTYRNQSYTIRGQLVLFYTCSHIGIKLFRWIEHDLSNGKICLGCVYTNLKGFDGQQQKLGTLLYVEEKLLLWRPSRFEMLEFNMSREVKNLEGPYSNPFYM